MEVTNKCRPFLGETGIIACGSTNQRKGLCQDRIFVGPQINAGFPLAEIARTLIESQ